MHKQNAQLLAAMIHYDRHDAMRIQHLVKVHGFAAAIGKLETLDEETQFILEAAATLHDVGIHLSLEYGSSAGKYQNGRPGGSWKCDASGRRIYRSADRSGQIPGGAPPHLQQYRWLGLSILVEADSRESG